MQLIHSKHIVSQPYFAEAEAQNSRKFFYRKKIKIKKENEDNTHIDNI